MDVKMVENRYLSFFKNKRIFITGNTGFVGSNISITLNLLDAKILGYSLKKRDKKYISNSQEYKKKFTTIYDDINNIGKHTHIIKKFKPQILIHLASQPIVKESFDRPLKTFESNIIGTIKLLEVVKKIKTLKNILIFTSDKVYKNYENTTLNEKSPLGGDDPYSSSKSAQDIISNSFKESFFKTSKNIFIIRAGNIIGGGDWEKSRLIPDLFISNNIKKNILLRNSKAIRPWQHIYDVINAILKLISKKGRVINPKSFTYNIGPKNNNKIRVIDLIVRFFKLSKFLKIKYKFTKIKFSEKKYLKISSKLFIKDIKWKPKLNLNNSIKLTRDWYFNFYKDKKNIYNFTEKQIKFFLNL
tara:strand:- start:894 stop:1967 length:1074 start_codon:yes stop_codon:yes gene_type:complete